MSRGAGEQGSRGTGEQGSRGTGTQGSRGAALSEGFAREQGSRGAGNSVTHHSSLVTPHSSLLTHHVSRITYHVPRRLRYFILVAIIILLTTLALFWLLPRDDGVLAEIQRRGTLRVGLDASFPPFESINGQGEIVGFDVEIARALAADLGVELELVNIGFDGLYDALLARQVDIVISGLPYDPRWTQDVAYTINYFNAGQVLISQTNNEVFQSVEDLAGRTIAVEWGSQAEMEGRRLADTGLNITLARQDTAAAAIEAVQNGQTEAAIVDAVSGLGATGEGIKIITYLSDEWYAAAVHIESRELLAAANRTLTRLAENGEMERLQRRWLKW